MPHTTTKSLRTKRVDTRPNAEQRKRMQRQIEDAKSIEEIRVTKKRKAEHVERDVAASKMVKTNDEKFVVSLKKKIKAIDGLLEQQKLGKTLDEQQLLKIDSLPEVLAKLEAILGNGSSDE